MHVWYHLTGKYLMQWNMIEIYGHQAIISNFYPKI